MSEKRDCIVVWESRNGRQDCWDGPFTRDNANERAIEVATFDDEACNIKVCVIVAEVQNTPRIVEID